MIVDPVTLPPDAPVAAALELMERYRISGVPVVDGSGRLTGILTNRDLRFEDDHSQLVSELMTSRDLVTAPVGTTLPEAEALLHRHKVEKPDRRPRGRAQGPDHRQGHQEADAVPAGDEGRARPPQGRRGGRRRGRCTRTRSRARRSRRRRARRRHCARARASGRRPRTELSSQVEVIAGNIATAEAAEALVDAGADALKLGVRSRFHLYDPCRRRRRRAADHRDLRLRTRRRRARRPRDRRRRDHVLRRRRQGARSRRGHRHAGSLLAGTDEAPGDVVVSHGERFRSTAGWDRSAR